MATTVVKTIGSTGDYSTIAAWIAAIPSNLVTVDEIWRGELLNEEFSAASEMFNIAGKTTDATRYIELTAAAGCSFLDSPTVRDTPLRYNASFGARVIRTSTYGYTGQISVPHTKISRLQIVNASSGTNAGAALYATATAGGIDIDLCVLESSSKLTGIGSLYLGYASKIRNSLVVQRDTAVSSIIARLYQGASAYGVTFAATNAVVSVGVQCDYGSPAMKNCYIGSAVAPVGGGVVPTTTNCFSDATASGFSVASFSDATFYSVVDATRDLRSASGSLLIDSGVEDLTNSPTDITGTPRTSPADVGAWEYVDVGGSNAQPTFPGPNIGNQTGIVGVALLANDVSSKFSDTDALTFSAIGTWPPGVTVSSAGVVSGTPTTDGVYSGLAVRATDTASQPIDSDTFSFTISAASHLITASNSQQVNTASTASIQQSGAGTITLPALGDWGTGNLKPNETGVRIIVNNEASGVLAVMLTNQTADASAVLPMISGLVSGTDYRITTILADGSEGTWVYTAS